MTDDTDALLVSAGIFAFAVIAGGFLWILAKAIGLA